MGGGPHQPQAIALGRSQGASRNRPGGATTIVVAALQGLRRADPGGYRRRSLRDPPTPAPPRRLPPALPQPRPPGAGPQGAADRTRWHLARRYPDRSGCQLLRPRAARRVLFLDAL